MMTSNRELLGKFQVKDFPRSAKYDPYWVHKHEMGPNVLWLTEALGQEMGLRPGMRKFHFLGKGVRCTSVGDGPLD